MRTTTDDKNATAAVIPAVQQKKKQTSPRRRLNALPDTQNPRKVTLEVFLRSKEEAGAFIDRTRKSKRLISDQLLKLIVKIANLVATQRIRDGNLQPQVPKSLRDKIKTLGHETGYGSGAAYLKTHINRLVNPKTGRRQKKKKGGNIRPADSKVFIARGRELIKDAKSRTNGEILTRYTYDAAQSKTGIMALTKAMDMTLSEFFSALMERAYVDWQRKQTKLKVGS
jgi:hypothetical protein